MTDRELLQMALDSLIDAADSQSWEMQQNIDQHGEWYRRSVYLKEAVIKSQEAIEALRARLEQPEPWVKTYSGGKPNYTQPIEQEPVAWGVDEGEGRCISLHDLYFVKEDADHMAELKGTHAKVVALYTAPPKKEWVGLTNDEIDAAVKSCNTTDTYKYFRAIEAKLKEKNT